MAERLLEVANGFADIEERRSVFAVRALCGGFLRGPGRTGGGRCCVSEKKPSSTGVPELLTSQFSLYCLPQGR